MPLLKQGFGQTRTGRCFCPPYDT